MQDLELRRDEHSHPAQLFRTGWLCGNCTRLTWALPLSWHAALLVLNGVSNLAVAHQPEEMSALRALKSPLPIQNSLPCSVNLSGRADQHGIFTQLLLLLLLLVAPLPPPPAQFAWEETCHHKSPWLPICWFPKIDKLRKLL